MYDMPNGFEMMCVEILGELCVLNEWVTSGNIIGDGQS
jgi:hypothetical protein